MSNENEGSKIRKVKSPLPVGIDKIPETYTDSITIQVMMPDGTIVTKIDQFNDISEDDMEIYYEDCTA